MDHRHKAVDAEWLAAQRAALLDAIQADTISELSVAVDQSIAGGSGLAGFQSLVRQLLNRDREALVALARTQAPLLPGAGSK